jgi:hypothetical protein
MKKIIQAYGFYADLDWQLGLVRLLPKADEPGK